MTRSTRFTRFCTFGIQLKNHEKRCGQASSGRSTRPRKRSYQTAAAMPGGVAKRGCTRARCSTSGSRDYADSKENFCTAPNLKIQSKFIKQFRACARLFSKVNLRFAIVVQISSMLMFFSEFQQLLRKISTSARFSNFMRFL